MERVQLQPAFILHQRPWRDSSLLLEGFSRQYGRVGLIAKGARRSTSRIRGVLQPFQLLLLSWSGRGELGTLTGAEPGGAAAPLPGSRLLCGFYLNELLIRLLHRDDPHPQLFDDYTQTLHRLAHEPAEEVVLRRFEKRLLEACGYGLNLTTEIESGEPVDPARSYQYLLEQGPRLTASGAATLTFSGASLLAIAEDRWDDEMVLRDAKRLLRAALDLYLGGRPLKTREVLTALRR